jgi:hypothetical protein
MTITLTPDIEQALTERAELQGTTPELLALHDLRVLYASEAALADTGSKTLAEMLAGHLGTVDSSEIMGGFPSYLSEDDGRSFADHLTEKRQQGRL